MKIYLKHNGKISIVLVIVLFMFFIYHRMTIDRYELQQHPHEPLVQQVVAENVETKNNDSSPRVFCLILTRPSPDVMKLEAVTNAWAKYCDGHVFVAKLAPTVNEKVLKAKHPILQPNGFSADTYKTLSTKVFYSFRDVYIEHKGFDWYLKADDDTMIFMDNLKGFLKDKNPTDPITFGYNFKVYVDGGYHSGGAGYLLSSESLRRFGEQLVVDQSYCSNSGTEDIDIAKCLRKLNIHMGESIDEMQRERFHPLSLTHHVKGNYPKWIYGYAKHQIKKGIEAISDTSISFHYTNKATMEKLGDFYKKYLQKKTEGKNVLPLSQALYELV